MTNPIDDLRETLSSQPPQETPRALKDVPNDLQKRLVIAAKKLNALPPFQRGVYVAALVYENARLLQEVNELRAGLGIAPLPVKDPLTGRVMQ